MQAFHYLVLNIILAFECLVILTRDFQLLQQNSYFVTRYFDNLKFKINKDYIFRALDIVIKTVFLIFVKNFYICLLYYLISFAVSFKIQSTHQKKSIKKIVFTQRVKRQYLTAAIILLSLSFVGWILFDDLVFSVMFNFITVLTILFVSLIKVINEPIEALFRTYYIHDAKKKLKSFSNMKVIGITGSFGKTSTKHVLERILSERYNVSMTPGGINTPMGIVRVIRESLPRKTDYFICEMGAKNVGDIKEICDIVSPEIGIITTVGAMHLSTFKTIENIKNTKLELADSALLSNGKVYFNGDNEYLAPEKTKYSAKTFGLTDSDNEFWAENICYSKDGSEFIFRSKDGARIELKTKLLGKNNVLNIILAVGIALDLGVSESDIKYSVSQLKAVGHRLELKPYINGSVLIDDAYNANPVGAREAINVLSSFDAQKKIIVTPGLIELGDKEYDENKQLGEYMADKCTKIILVGEQRSVPLLEGIKSVNNNVDVSVVKSFYEALEILKPICDKNTVVIFENDLPDNYLK